MKHLLSFFWFIFGLILFIYNFLFSSFFYVAAESWVVNGTCTSKSGCGTMNGCIYDQESIDFGGLTFCPSDYQECNDNTSQMPSYLAKHWGDFSWSCAINCSTGKGKTDCSASKEEPTVSCAAVNNNKACMRHNDNGDDPDFVYFDGKNADIRGYECKCKKTCSQISKTDHSAYFWQNAHNYLAATENECRQNNDTNIPAKNYVALPTFNPAVYDGSIYGNYSLKQTCLNCFTSSDPWFRVINSNFASYDSITGQLINSSNSLPYLIDNESCSSANNHSGIPVIESQKGKIVAKNDFFTNRINPKTSAVGTKMASSLQKKETFSYFQNLINYNDLADVGCTSYNYIGQNNVVDSQVCVVDRQVDNDIIYLTTPIHIGNGQKKVVFIKGSLKIQTEIKVDMGGFLAFIVSQDISFSSDLGIDITSSQASKCPNSSQSQIDGVFIADGNIIFEEKIPETNQMIQRPCNNQLVLTGNYVGWGGIKMGRSSSGMSSTFAGCLTNSSIASKTYFDYNAYYPVYTFINRPDITLNTPQWMRHILRLTFETQ